MNWEAIGAFAEMIGSAAVLATLVYLAVQVRHSRDLLEENRKVALSQVYRDRVNIRIDHEYSSVDQNWLKIEAKLYGGSSYNLTNDEFLKNFEALAVEERLAVMHFEEAITHSVDNSLYQAELGLLDELAIKNLSGVVDGAFSRRHIK